jgi:hypothetical protein
MTSIHSPFTSALRRINTVDLLEDIILHLEKPTPSWHTSIRNGLGQSVDKSEYPIQLLHTWSHVGADEKVVGDFGAKIGFFDKMITSSKSIFVDNV